MADELIDSSVRVTFDPEGDAVVLVDFGDPMWDLVRLDGQQIVEVVSRPRAAGVKTFSRGNEQHQLTFTKCGITEDPAAAIYQRFVSGIYLPKESGDVLIEVDGYGAFRLKSGTVTNWPSESLEHLTRQSVAITGGELLADEGTYVPGMTWDQENQNWED